MRNCRRAHPETSSDREVLRRPRHPPGGDGRLLRAPLVRAAHVPRAFAARPRAPGRRLRLPDPGAEPCLSHDVAQEHPHARASRAGQRGDARHRRRRRTALVVALALQRARVRIQHRLRPPEPLVPARQGDRGDRHGRDDHDALRQPRHRRARRRSRQALRAGVRREHDRRATSSRSPSRCSASSSSCSRRTGCSRTPRSPCAT